MSATITIAPVRKSVQVQTSQGHAFEVFTSGLGRWWPTNMTIGKPPMKMAVFEPRLGGLWYELSEDGSKANVGRVLVWEPPHRFVMSWEVNSNWVPDTSVATEVEVSFFSEGPNLTRVELVHRKFEVLGKEGGNKMRGDVDGGWPGLLQHFKREAEKTAKNRGAAA